MLGTFVSIVLIGGVLILIGSVIAGFKTYNPRRANAVRAAEAVQPAVMVETLQQLRFYHPEIIRTTRLDRHDTYVLLHIGLLAYGLGVILAPAPNSNLTALSFATQQALGLCLLVGSSTALAGITLGVKVTPKRRIARRVAENMMTEMLGDDIRLPYTLGWLGLLSVGVSMTYYASSIIYASHGRLYGTLGGGLSIAIGVMCVTLGVRFLARIRAYSRARNQLIAEAIAHLGLPS